MAAHVRLSFVRLNSWPKGVRYHVLWNGSIDSAGEGRPNANPAADVDGQNPLTRRSIEIWPAGKAGYGDGPHGRGLFGRNANWHAGYGYGKGLHGEGEHGLHADRVVWSTESVLTTLRDGTYRFAVRLEDEHGTAQVETLQPVVVSVKGVPRPPRNLRMVGFADGALTVAWDHSPDLA